MAKQVVLPRTRLSLSSAVAILCTLASLVIASEPQAAPPFYLRDGDRVVFYGDSITEQAHFTRPIEIYLRTRRPGLNVSFVNSGWGGERAWGGDGGMLDERLERDVIAHRPSVVTVMLGMNDGYYTNFSAEALQAFEERIETLIATLQHKLPGVRITLLGTSPYDNVTPGEQPEWERGIDGGYNSVVARYVDSMRKLSERHDLVFVDMNAPLVKMLEQLQVKDPQLARKLIPDRIHPGPAAGLLMAARLLDAWHAPQREHVTRVTAAGAEGNSLQVRQQLPLPYPIDRSDPLTKALVEFAPAMNVFAGNTLRITDLPFSRAKITVAGEPLGEFSAKELAAGVELSPPNSSLARRAHELADLITARDRLKFAYWRLIASAEGEQASSANQTLKKELAAIENSLAELTRSMAEPTPTTIDIQRLPE